MEIHDDWKPLLATFKGHYKLEANPAKLFGEFCEGKGINPKEPKAKETFGYDWTGNVLLEGDWKEFAAELGVEAEEGMYLVGGRAIHPCKTHHPNEWPEWRIYLEAELAASAATATNQPFWMDHAIPLGNRNKIFGARYYDGELQYVGQVEEYLKNMIESGEIKHISPGFEWTVLEKLNGIAPRGIRYYEFSLLKNLRPGDSTTTVELWEALLGQCRDNLAEGVKPYQAVELNQFIESKLLDKRILMFHGSVDEGICREASQRLEYMASVSDEPIKIILNSVGGGVFDGLLVFDTIKRLTNSGIEVLCEARGLAASMGSIILQAGTKRTATPHTRFLIHEVSSVAWGKASTVTEEAAEIEKVNNLLKGILAERSGKTPDEIEEVWRKTDVWMSAKEAEEFGLIDEIVTGMVEGHHPTVGFFTAPFAELALDTTIQCPECGHVSTKDQWLQTGMGGNGKCTQCGHEVQTVTLVEAKVQEPAIDYAVIAEALGITEAAFNELAWEERFKALADFFEGKMKEQSEIGDTFIVFHSTEEANAAETYAVMVGVSYERHGNALYFTDTTAAKLVWTNVPGGDLTHPGWEGIKEATAAQAREHHGISEEDWAALSDEDKAKKMESTPAAAEGVMGNLKRYGDFAQSEEVACPGCSILNFKSDLMQWDHKCNHCGYQHKFDEFCEGKSAEGPKDDTARAKTHHSISDEDWDAMTEEDRAAKIADLPATGSGREGAKLMEMVQIGDEVSPFDLMFDSQFSCPNCNNVQYLADSMSNSMPGAESTCTQCGTILDNLMVTVVDPGSINMYFEGRTRLATIKELLRPLEEALVRAKALAGEAVLVPTGMSSLEIPGYISATLVEGVIPKQMHHKAQPGYQRVVRELRSLVKKSREVN